MHMGEDEVHNLLQKVRERPKVITRQEFLIDREILHEDEKIVELDRGNKVVVYESVVQTTVKYFLVREFNPQLSYADSIKEFMDESSFPKKQE